MRRWSWLMVLAATSTGCGGVSEGHGATSPTPSSTPASERADVKEYETDEARRRAEKDAADKKAQETGDKEVAEYTAKEKADAAKAKEAKLKKHKDECGATFGARVAAAKKAVTEGRKEDARDAAVLAWAEKHCTLVNTEATQIKKTGPDTVEVKKVGHPQDLKCNTTVGRPPELSTEWYQSIPDPKTSYSAADVFQNGWCADIDPVDLSVPRTDKPGNDKILAYVAS